MCYSYLGTVTKLERVITGKHFNRDRKYYRKFASSKKQENANFLSSTSKKFPYYTILKTIKKKKICPCLLTDLLSFKYLKSGQSLIWCFSTRSETLNRVARIMKIDILNKNLIFTRFYIYLGQEPC